MIAGSGRPTVVVTVGAATGMPLTVTSAVDGGRRPVTGGPRRRHRHRVARGLPPAVQVLSALRLVFRRLPQPAPLRPRRTALTRVLRRAQAHVLVRPRVSGVRLVGRRAAAVPPVRFAKVGLQQRRVRYAVRSADGAVVVATGQLRRRLVAVVRRGGRAASFPGPSAARARPEQRQEHGQQDHAVQGAERAHQEDHLEEHHEYVAAGQYQGRHAQHRADRALHDRQAQRVQALTDPIRGPRRPGRHVRVAYVRGEVHGEPDAHDQVHHGYRVQVDAP